MDCSPFKVKPPPRERSGQELLDLLAIALGVLDICHSANVELTQEKLDLVLSVLGDVGLPPTLALSLFGTAIMTKQPFAEVVVDARRRGLAILAGAR
jgi:hypothetical protein